MKILEPNMVEQTTKGISEVSADTEHKEYIVTGLRGKTAVRQGLAPMSAGQMEGLKKFLEQAEDIQLVRSYRQRRSRVAVASAMAGEAEQEHHVVRMDGRRAAELRQSGEGRIIVGENLPLTPDNGYIWYNPYATAPVWPVSQQLPVYSSPYAVAPRPQRNMPLRQPPRPPRLGRIPEKTVRLKVIGADGKPAAGATVTLQGGGLPQSGKTNIKGELSISVLLHRDQAPAFLQVAEVPNCWDFYLKQPKLDYDATNLIRLVPLQKTLESFPARFRMGWGQRLMGLDLADGRIGGEGVKVAVVDSGADAEHPLLAHIAHGRDLLGGSSDGWRDDEIGHGTHVSGVIAANGRDGGMRGFVPNAEVHALKIFPGGQLSTLIEALDYCIEHGIDVVNLSLGTSESSDAFPAVEQKIEEAAEAGVACIVAAGNSSGPVQYPASSPLTLAVSALGKQGEFPLNSWNTATVDKDLMTSDGIFFPSYSCLGEGVNVCAPGSAIISTWPGNSFAPDSGTSMAAPHVTGLAAMLLAHHPLFLGEQAVKGLERVRLLFSLITQIANQLPALGTERTGAGLPTLHQLLQT